MMVGETAPDEARASAIALARRSFFESGDLPDKGVPASILRSWQRCRHGGLVHTCADVPDPVTRVQLSDARERSASLLEHASAIMEQVFEQIRASGSMVILSDTDGMIVHSLGDADFVDRARRVSLQPGACWGEGFRGTNAIGTAIAEETPVDVLGPEHFLEDNGFLTCSAAPIFDAHRRLAGVFDISGDCRAPQRHTMGLVRLSVQMLEKRLFETEFSREIIIAFHPRPEYLGSLQEAMIAVSADGRILGANQAARDQFARLCVGNTWASFGSLFKPRFGALLDRAAHAAGSAEQAMRLDLRDGGALYAQIRGMRPVMGSAPRTRTRQADGVTGPSVAPCDAAAGTRVTLDCLDTGDLRLHRALDRAGRILGKNIPLLIQGDSGVGKELFAQAFHNSGPRRDGPFVALNCAAIPENLIESELFGYAGGAFTGARREGAIGRIQQACGGTLFLDEIGDMPLTMQARLLRVLQERSVNPVGSCKSVAVDVSLVCATHRNLREAVARGKFREDLYYRVNGLMVALPSLQERSDIRSLVSQILSVEAGTLRGRPVEISEEVLCLFETLPWPGNIRQLQNVIRVAVALLDDDEEVISPCHLPEELFAGEASDRAAGTAVAATPKIEPAACVPRTLGAIEVDAIAAVMRETGGNVSAAARRLGISRNTLYRKIGRLQ